MNRDKKTLILEGLAGKRNKKVDEAYSKEELKMLDEVVKELGRNGWGNYISSVDDKQVIIQGNNVKASGIIGLLVKKMGFTETDRKGFISKDSVEISVTDTSDRYLDDGVETEVVIGLK
jgi:hypothetical protein